MSKLYPYLSLIDSFSDIREWAAMPIIQETPSLIPKHETKPYKPKKAKDGKKVKHVHKKYYHK